MDRDEALKLLKGGREGVREWNQRRRADEGVAGGKLRPGAIELVWRGPFRTHRRRRDCRFWAWPWHSVGRIAFPDSFGGRNAVDDCRFHPFWEIAAPIPKARRSFLVRLRKPSSPSIAPYN